MAWYVYDLVPIDFGWENLKTVSEMAAEIGAREGSAKSGEDIIELPSPSLSEFLAGWGAAKEQAANAGWDGDFREDPVVFWLPFGDSHDFKFGFVFKQDNNGTTYVVSPIQLQYLEG